MGELSSSLDNLRYGVLRRARNAGFVIAAAAAVFSAAQASAQTTIAALGDSLTQGYGLAPDDGFVPRLQAWLDASDLDATVLNFGVSGDTTAGGLARIDWTLTDDIDALIVALGGNDLLRGIDPSVSRDNLNGILAAAGKRNVPVLLVGMSAPSNYGEEFKQAFDSMYPEIAAAHGALLYTDFLTPLAEIQDRSEVLRLYMQADAIHPNAEGVILIVEGIGPHVADLVKLAATQ